MMDMHIERIVPDSEGWEAYFANHIFRYKFALQTLQKNGISSNVLDAACGVGYGSYYLAQNKIKEITGVDISKEAIVVAQAKFLNNEIQYLIDDCSKLQNNKLNSSYNAIISFETLEHLSNPEAFLERTYSLLKSDGTLIISTPNINETKHFSKSDWHFHEKEYTAVEFIKLLTDTGYKNIRLMGQHYSELGQLRNSLRHELHTIASNPAVRLGKIFQKMIKGREFHPILPEQLTDFELKEYQDPAECDRLEVNKPFVLLALADK